MKTKPHKALEIENLTFRYGNKVVLQDITLQAFSEEVVAIVGPSGCGKTSLLRCLNRMNDVYEEATIDKGRILIFGEDINRESITPIELRKSVGMVFQRTIPFPKTIYENIAYGPKIHGVRHKNDLDERVESSLRSVDLWNEVKDRLSDSAFELSVGQQKRLCIARAIAVQPSILLLDEPCDGLDPINTAKVEELLHELKKSCTLIFATYNMQQAARVSDSTGFLNGGRIIEFNTTDNFFMNPQEPETEAYISGRFG